MTRLVSVVLPTYNQAEYLGAALESVAEQSYLRFELIVVNDGSTDHTAEVLADYQNKLPFRLISQRNQGIAKALNAGFSVASGEYLTWTSSDNILGREMIAELAKALDHDPDAGLVYADHQLIDSDGALLGTVVLPDYDRHLLLHTNMIHCCFLYRRKCMDAIGGYAPGLPYAEDWEYWIRMSIRWKMKHVPLNLYSYRLHSSSLTTELLSLKSREASYIRFSRLIRQRWPVRWWIGKLKWWKLRLFQRSHPIVSSQMRWQLLAERGML